MAASVDSMLEILVEVCPGVSGPFVFLLFRGRGGEMSRDRLEGTAIVVEATLDCSNLVPQVFHNNQRV